MTQYDVVEKNPTYYGTLISSLKIGNSIRINLTEGNYSETGYILTNGGVQVSANLELEITRGGRHRLIKFTISSVINGKTYYCKYSNAGTSTDNCTVRYNDFDEDIIVSGGGTILSSGPLFLNTNESFNRRKKDSTLIPGEIYSFYIHFVNKYGEATDGYKIPNIFGQQNVTEVVVVAPAGAMVQFPINQRVFDETGEIYRSGNEIINYINPVTEQEVYDTIKGAYSSLKNIANLKWFQVPSAIPINASNYFIPFINDNGDILYKVPYDDFSINGTTITYPIYKLKFDLNGFELPKDYIGYYFSYEKFEPTIKLRGIVTKRDASQQTSIVGSGNEIDYNKYNSLDIHKIDSIHFYSSDLDNDDNVDLDFNAIYILKSITLQANGAAYTSNSKVEFANAKYPANLNMPEIGGSTYNAIYGVDKATLSIAGDALKDKRNLGTSIELAVNDISGLFVSNTNVYKSALVKISTNIYTNENKILVKFTNIYYEEEQGIVERGLNGHFTYNDFIVFDFNKFVFNSSNNVILSEKYGTYYKTDVFDIDSNDDGDYNDDEDYVMKYMSDFRAPLYYVQLMTYDVLLKESKSFKNEPSIYYLQLEKTNPDVPSQIKQFAQNIIVLPENTVDLFENKYPNQDSLNPKTFTNYDYNKSYLDEYNKRVRRSNVIADESNENSWRVFPLEGYKDITENKGIITNIVGVGTTFLVHTEHSLFMFDRNNTLQTADKEVQLAMPDIFDVDYKEVFTSDLGICGLQDRDAHIVDQFGYIFYDNDAHRIYKFGQGKIENIDLDIIQFLNKHKPYRIRFANDKEANRLLVNMYFHSAIEAVPQEETLSFNYVINKWISFHDYVFDTAFNTKQMLYYILIWVLLA